MENKLNKREYLAKEELDNFKLDRTMNDYIGTLAITIRDLIKKENLSDRELYRKIRCILLDVQIEKSEKKDELIKLYKSKADDLDTIIKILKRK